MRDHRQGGTGEFERIQLHDQCTSDSDLDAVVGVGGEWGYGEFHGRGGKYICVDDHGGHAVGIYGCGTDYVDDHGDGDGIGYGHGHQWMRGQCGDGDGDDSVAGGGQHFGRPECVCQQRDAADGHYLFGQCYGRIGQLHLQVGEQH